jgi:hypothetical protein
MLMPVSFLCLPFLCPPFARRADICTTMENFALSRKQGCATPGAA